MAQGKKKWPTVKNLESFIADECGKLGSNPLLDGGDALQDCPLNVDAFFGTIEQTLNDDKNLSAVYAADMLDLYMPNIFKRLNETGDEAVRAEVYMFWLDFIARRVEDQERLLHLITETGAALLDEERSHFRYEIAFEIADSALTYGEKLAPPFFQRKRQLCDFVMGPAATAIINYTPLSPCGTQSTYDSCLTILEKNGDAQDKLDLTATMQTHVSSAEKSRQAKVQKKAYNVINTRSDFKAFKLALDGARELNIDHPHTLEAFAIERAAPLMEEMLDLGDVPQHMAVYEAMRNALPTYHDVQSQFVAAYGARSVRTLLDKHMPHDAAAMLQQMKDDLCKDGRGNMVVLFDPQQPKQPRPLIACFSMSHLGFEDKTYTNRDVVILFQDNDVAGWDNLTTDIGRLADIWYKNGGETEAAYARATHRKVTNDRDAKAIRLEASRIAGKIADTPLSDSAWRRGPHLYTCLLQHYALR